MTKSKPDQLREDTMRAQLKSLAPRLTIEQAIRALTKDVKFLYEGAMESDEHIMDLEAKVRKLEARPEIKLEKG